MVSGVEIGTRNEQKDEDGAETSYKDEQTSRGIRWDTRSSAFEDVQDVSRNVFGRGIWMREVSGGSPESCKEQEISATNKDEASKNEQAFLVIIDVLDDDLTRCMWGQVSYRINGAIFQFLLAARLTCYRVCFRVHILLGRGSVATILNSVAAVTNCCGVTKPRHSRLPSSQRAQASAPLPAPPHLPASALTAPATFPPVPSIVLQCPSLPWNITVEPSPTASPSGAEFISVQDVLDALYSNMQTQVKEVEFKALAAAMGKAVSDVFGKRWKTFVNGMEREK
ncbi:uncharacterized protein STEHIDRAFT_115632 [Stereum hirsutum FP-91666 SS1]|uniref:uncharacterized protein n=1 Tax=Stereum hirsutum (strain FP-91666) TaxID=721885 RepID=UPI000444A3C4|nr:uncharacterized protein STEHIDRAFT_115632 [Stereum hirsutum FP-91666 SS1]EIM80781.1 hypothetical protein STEHIDRAFT_115632 [Stereum hirsutum FP-91666 SS1]